MSEYEKARICHLFGMGGGNELTFVFFGASVQCSLFLLDKEHSELVAEVFEKNGTSDEYLTEIRMPLSKGIVGHVASTGQMMNVDDVYKVINEPRYELPAPAKAGEQSTKSYHAFSGNVDTDGAGGCGVAVRSDSVNSLTEFGSVGKRLAWVKIKNYGIKTVWTISAHGPTEGATDHEKDSFYEWGLVVMPNLEKENHQRPLESGMFRPEKLPKTGEDCLTPAKEED
ncbi:unnamed protein product [Anisakis simplex]|uniref:CN hydrolase domain-containing protein n=1 Tax=Anisakis simplex TaxID=6269 RepID=A0A0M3JYZ8_ANISI|nr:unnamed protein product [Anisakis simplex]